MCVPSMNPMHLFIVDANSIRSDVLLCVSRVGHWIVGKKILYIFIAQHNYFSNNFVSCINIFVEYPAELFRFRRVLDDILSSFDVF